MSNSVTEEGTGGNSGRTSLELAQKVTSFLIGKGSGRVSSKILARGVFLNSHSDIFTNYKIH